MHILRHASCLISAQRVLGEEAAALQQLSSTLNDGFVAACAALFATQGRIIVTGMGKSGHIARKIAATLASTGSPAQFVHPGEASHGDLGMITRQDSVIALSNSGETHELYDVLNYCKRFNIPLVAITAGADSELARAATYLLQLPKLPEACPLELAPMTSTTMMLGLGDAIAVALMELRGFTADIYKNYHPGGKLGRKLLTVENLMHGGEQLPLAAAATLMSDILIIMSQKGFGCVGIIDNHRLVGIITDGDLRRHMAPDLIQQTARDVMSPAPKIITPEKLAVEALAIMNDKNITSLFVTNAAQTPLGIIHIHDVLRAGVE